MIFKIAFWQLQLLAFAFLWVVRDLVQNKFVVGLGGGLIAMQCLDSFIIHYNEFEKQMAVAE